MWFRVASRLGRTVEELQEAMTGAEFRDWCAFYSFEPWGHDAENWRMGVLAATTANFSGRTKKPLKPSDFLPRTTGSKRKMNPNELRAGLKAAIKKAPRDATEA